MTSRFHSFGFLLGGAIFCALSFARGGSAIPDGYPADRYAPLWTHSPFTLASVQQEAAPGFAQNLAVVGIVRIGSEDWVTLLNKQSQERFIVGAEPDEQGVKVVAVVTDADPLKTRVTIQKGGELATVGFDRTLLATTQTPPVPAISSLQPPVPPNMGNMMDMNSGSAPLLPVVLRQRRRPSPIPGVSPAPVPPPNAVPVPSAAPPPTQ